MKQQPWRRKPRDFIEMWPVNQWLAINNTRSPLPLEMIFMPANPYRFTTSFYLFYPEGYPQMLGLTG
ncbi:hypothetical protein FKG94_08295 [Exilibacterium tricleocarpae]|uniref:Uncharacterized protein n=1 Tax=Exilibacterium tricleocarpae TaxID=2591008 RepID=A0A545TZS8_9GAMM|nr:hypothetical protein [Exilibacterium tricleocarpae]TQV82715.1 hypothetical protein FKG94_08295 [Exilibacterium tricleocarpae]